MNEPVDDRAVVQDALARRLHRMTHGMPLTEVNRLWQSETRTSVDRLTTQALEAVSRLARVRR